MPTDQELVDRYRSTGQVEALDELARQHMERIRSLVFSMVLDDAVADDLTQEVFLRAFRSLDRFDGRSQFSTWLYRIAVNTTYSHLDRGKRSPVAFSDTPPEAADHEDTRPDGPLLTTELKGQIEAGLAALSPRLRGAIVLTTIEKLAVKEAARIEGCSTATMYWRVHEARKQLKQKLKSYLSS